MNSCINSIYLKGVLLPVIVLFLTGCHKGENDQLKQQNARLETQLRQTDSTVNTLLTTFNEIDSNLALIRQKEGLIDVNYQENPDKKKKILDDIQTINSLLEENRKKISVLQEDLKKSGRNVRQFEKKLNLLQTQFDEKVKDIELLKESLVAKDFEIATLNSTVDTLNTTVTTQRTVIHQQDTFINKLDKALNTSYFAEGTYKELKEKGLIDNNGWTPWTGKKVVLNDNLTKAGFREIDIRETTSIPLNTKKATLVSNHPEGTYEFRENDGLIASLEIKDPLSVLEYFKISCGGSKIAKEFREPETKIHKKS